MERGKVIYSNDVVEAELKTLKEDFRQNRERGTVKEWNELREEAKEYYSEQIISALDASGYIVKWLEGN